MRTITGFVGLALLAAACSAAPQESPWPADAEVFIDQPRTLRDTRTVVLRVANEGPDDIRVTSITLTSPRVDTVTSDAAETVLAGYGRDLELTIPPGRCGEAVAARVVLDYEIDGTARRSVIEPDDRYEAVRRLLDADCAGAELAEAATVTPGPPEIESRPGRDVAMVPVTFWPTGARDDVVVTGFAGTTLFTLAPDMGTESIRLTGRSRTVPLRLVPARCDAHALADDKVGTLLPMTMRSDRVADGRVVISMDDDVRADLIDYWVAACELTGESG